MNTLTPIMNKEAAALPEEVSINLEDAPIINRFVLPGSCVNITDLHAETREEHLYISCLIQLEITGMIQTILTVNYVSAESMLKLPTSSDLERTPDVFWIEFDHDKEKPEGESKKDWYRFNRLGIEFFSDAIKIYIELDLFIKQVSIGLYEFYVKQPFEKTIPEVFLSGLSIGMTTPTFTLAGGLFRETPRLYSGEIFVKFGQFGFVAMGSFGYMEDDTVTLFAYLLVNVPISIPPVVITGISAGFGVNRTLLLPSKAENVKDFPFVLAAMNDGDLQGERSPMRVLSSIGDRIVPSKGAYFVSAGIAFTIFELLNCYAVLNIEFGNRIVVSLLGMATLSLPPQSETAEKGMKKYTFARQLAYASLTLKIVIDPQEGMFSFSSALTNDSYIFSKQNKLQGGFALALWTSGDFAVTIGGYHPHFDHGHYPDANRVGFFWNIADHISLLGEAYFALTPKAIMAGTSFKLIFGPWNKFYLAKNFKAWIRSYMDLFLQWKPLYYDALIGVRAGVSAEVGVSIFRKNVAIEIGADLHIRGPEFGGYVLIDCYILSKEISFGAVSSRPDFLNWNEFRDAFLKGAPILSAAVVDGFMKTVTDENDNIISYKVHADSLIIDARTRVPCDHLEYVGNTSDSEVRLGVTPMNLLTYHATLEVDIVRKKGSASELVTDVDASVIYENVPSAVWGKPSFELPVSSDDSLIEHVPVGVRVEAHQHAPQKMLPSPDGFYDMKVLTQNEDVLRDGDFYNPANYPAATAYHDNSIQVIQRTVNAQAAASNRNAILSLFDDLYVPSEIDVLALTQGNYWLAPPILNNTGALR